MTLDLVRPHGFLLWRGKKTAVLTPGELPVGEELEVATGDERFGVAVLGHPARMLASESDRKEWFARHRVYRDEREAWWPGETKFNCYPVESFQAYGEIERAWAGLKDAGDGRDCPECLHEGGGWCRLHDVLVEAGKGCPEWELFGDWRGDPLGDKEPEDPQVKPEVGEMPYDMEERDGKYCVVKTTTGEVEKCHDGRDEAEAHLAALRINVEAEEGKAAEIEPDGQGEALEAAKAVTKSEGDGDHPAGHYLVVEDPESPTTWHLRYRDADGNVDHRLMGAAWAALHGGYRGNKYQGPDADKALARLKKLYEAEGLETPGEKALEPAREVAATDTDRSEPEEVCACSECGAELPCDAVGDCPECGEPLVSESEGTDTDAEPDAVEEKASLAERIKAKLGGLRATLTMSRKEEPRIALLGLIESGDQGVLVKSVNGEPWLVTWSSNAFKDRDQEIFSTKGLERYVAAAEEKGDRGFFNFWHVPGTDFAEKRWQGVIGRILVEAGPFLDTPLGRAAKQFFTDHPEGHPKIAKEGWGCSVEYRYLPEQKSTGVYDDFWVTRTSVLPRAAAANTQTKGGVIMALTKKQREGLGEIFPEDAEDLIQAAEARTKELEDELEFKGKDGDEGAEPEPQQEPGELDMAALAAELAKHFDVKLEPIEDLAEENKQLRAMVQELAAQVEGLKSRPEPEDDLMPRFQLSLEKRRASSAEETELKDGDPLLEKKPAETKAEKGGASAFFPTPK